MSGSGLDCASPVCLKPSGGARVRALRAIIWSYGTGWIAPTRPHYRSVRVATSDKDRTRHTRTRNGRFRRVSPVALHSREGPMTEPTADAQPWPQERVLMLHTCRSQNLSGAAQFGWISVLHHYARRRRGRVRAVICPARVERQEAEPTASVAAADASWIMNFGHRY